MTSARALLLGLAGAVAFAAAAAAQDMSLLFTSADAWRKLSLERKTALAADFMRVFCVRQTMEAAALVGCLDKATPGDLYDRALDCVKQLSSTP